MKQATCCQSQTTHQRKENAFWKEHGQSKKQKASIKRELQAAIVILIISDRGLRFGPANSLRESLTVSNKLLL